MNKVKTFMFKVCSSCTDDNMHMKKQNAHDEYETLYNQERIDKEINEFIKNKKVINISVTQVPQSYSEAGKTNIIILVYTITYIPEVL